MVAEIRAGLAVGSAPSTGAGNPTSLGRLGRKFEHLKAQQDILDKIKSQAEDRDSFQPLGFGMLRSAPNRGDAQCSKNLDDMFTLGWAAEASRARSLDDLVVKATILKEWCVPQDDDLAHALAFSLCKDILALIGDGRGESQVSTSEAFTQNLKRAR